MNINKMQNLSFSEKIALASTSTSPKELLELAKNAEARLVPFILSNKYSTIEVTEYLSYSIDLSSLRDVAKAKKINTEIACRLAYNKDQTLSLNLLTNSSIELEKHIFYILYNNIIYRSHPFKPTDYSFDPLLLTIKNHKLTPNCLKLNLNLYLMLNHLINI